MEQNACKSLTVARRGYVLRKSEVVLSGGAAELLQSQEVQNAYRLSG